MADRVAVGPDAWTVDPESPNNVARRCRAPLALLFELNRCVDYRHAKACSANRGDNRRHAACKIFRPPENSIMCHMSMILQHGFLALTSITK